MAANGITAQYKITLKGLPKHKSNEGSGLFDHIFIAFRDPPQACSMAGVPVGIYSQKHTRGFTRESSLSLSSLLIFADGILRKYRFDIKVLIH